MTDDSDRKRATAAAFGDAAAGYAESAVHRTGADLDRLAAWCADADRALDVATAAGHTAGALADAGVGTVVAADFAPEMVATATGNFDVAGLVADAERLPFRDGSFDAVACRIAAHHFPDPEAFVAEAARVLTPGGVLAFEDNVAPVDDGLAAFLNRVEAVRDPTHVESYTVKQWREWVEAAGLTVEECLVIEKELDYAAWVERMDVPRARRCVLAGLFHGAPDEVRECFAVETDGAEVRSFTTPKVLLRATR